MTTPAHKQLTKKQRFQEIYSQFASMVRSVGFRTAGADGIDDMVQETFIKVWQGMDRFDGRSSLKTWIYRIAVNTAVDSMRKRKRSVFTNAGRDLSLVSDQQIDMVSEQDLIEKALAELSEDYRVTLVLFVFEGLKVQEIAEVTSVKEGTVKSRLTRARQTVREYLRQNGVEL